MGDGAVEMIRDTVGTGDDAVATDPAEDQVLWAAVDDAVVEWRVAAVVEKLVTNLEVVMMTPGYCVY
jgi:hypothetical protein